MKRNIDTDYMYKIQRLDWFDDNPIDEIWKGAIHFIDENQLEETDSSIYISEQDLIFMVVHENTEKILKPDYPVDEILSDSV